MRGFSSDAVEAIGGRVEGASPAFEITNGGGDCSREDVGRGIRDWLAVDVGWDDWWDLLDLRPVGDDIRSEDPSVKRTLPRSDYC